MKLNNIQEISKPRKQIFDFLSYLEKETDIQFKNNSAEGISAFVTEPVKDTTICIPAEFYLVKMKNIPLAIELRYCPCENCNIINYVNILYEGKNNMNEAIRIKKQIDPLVPDTIMIYINASSVFQAIRDHGAKNKS